MLFKRVFPFEQITKMPCCTAMVEMEMATLGQIY